MHLKPSMKAIIQYVSGSYFGDSDLFRSLSGEFGKPKGRNLTAIGDDLESIIFVMKRPIVLKIKDNFDEEFQEMMKVGIKRFKHHQCLISQELERYVDYLKQNLSDFDELSNEEDKQNQNDVSELNISLDSQDLD